MMNGERLTVPIFHGSELIVEERAPSNHPMTLMLPALSLLSCIHTQIVVMTVRHCAGLYHGSLHIDEGKEETVRMWHASQQGRGFTKHTAWTRFITALVVVVFVHVVVISTAWAEQMGGGSNEQTESNGAQYGLGTASVFLTIPYGMAKFLFATLGGIFGGFTYAFSGANEKAAKSVWDTSMRGTYVITPEHLKGEKSVRFFGVPPAESGSEGVSSEPAPLEPEPIK